MVWTVGAVSVTVESEADLGGARNRAIDEEYLRAQLGRLGNTPYELEEVELKIGGAPFAASSMLNQLRREAGGKLQAAQGAGGRRPCTKKQKTGARNGVSAKGAGHTF